MTRIRVATATAIVLLAGAAAAAPLAVAVEWEGDRASGTYVILAGEDTAVIERWNRTDTDLDVTMDVVGQARLEFRAGLAGDASVSTMAMRVFGPAGGEAMGEATATFSGDSVVAIQTGANGKDTVHRETRAGAVAYLSPSVVLTEQIVRRARVMGGESALVPVFVVGSGGQTLDATVSFRGDSVSVRLAESELVLSMLPDGGIAGGSIPGEPMVRIVRMGG